MQSYAAAFEIREEGRLLMLYRLTHCYDANCIISFNVGDHDNAIIQKPESAEATFSVVETVVNHCEDRPRKSTGATIVVTRCSHGKPRSRRARHLNKGSLSKKSLKPPTSSRNALCALFD